MINRGHDFLNNLTEAKIKDNEMEEMKDEDDDDLMKAKKLK